MAVTRIVGCGYVSLVGAMSSEAWTNIADHVDEQVRCSHQSIAVQVTAGDVCIRKVINGHGGTLLSALLAIKCQPCGPVYSTHDQRNKGIRAEAMRVRLVEQPVNVG